MWWSFSCAVAAEAEWLRPAYVAYLRARGEPEADYFAAELIFGELISNVVRHAPGPIRVDVTWADGLRPTLSVTDLGGGFALREILPENILEESGRGLFLVSAFGEGLTVEANVDGSNSVRVTLPIRADPERRLRFASIGQPVLECRPLCGTAANIVPPDHDSGV